MSEMKAQGTIDVFQGCEDHEKLMEVFESGEPIQIEMDHYKGYARVVEASSYAEERKVKTRFEIISND